MSRLTNLDRNNLQYWASNGRIPSEHVVEVILACRRAGVDVTPNDLFDVPEATADSAAPVAGAQA